MLENDLLGPAPLNSIDSSKSDGSKFLDSDVKYMLPVTADNGLQLLPKGTLGQVIREEIAISNKTRWLWIP